MSSELLSIFWAISPGMRCCESDENEERYLPYTCASEEGEAFERVQWHCGTLSAGKYEFFRQGEEGFKNTPGIDLVVMPGVFLSSDEALREKAVFRRKRTDLFTPIVDLVVMPGVFSSSDEALREKAVFRRKRTAFIHPSIDLTSVSRSLYLPYSFRYQPYRSTHHSSSPNLLVHTLT